MGADLAALLVNLMILGLTGLYFVPVIVAVKRQHHQVGAIAVINICLGWTMVGWVVAMAMAAGNTQPRYQPGPYPHWNPNPPWGAQPYPPHPTYPQSAEHDQPTGWPAHTSPRPAGATTPAIEDDPR